MSSKKQGTGSRFAGQLSSLTGRPAPEAESPQTSVPQPDTEPLENFSSHMRRDLKRRLKMAAAKDGRKQYEIVGELVEAWLDQQHPET